MIRIALRDPVAARDFAALAEGEGWELDGSVPAQPGVAEEFVWSVRTGTDVHWFNDPVLHRVYVMIDGPGEAAAADRVRAVYPVISPAQAAADYADAPDWPERVEILSALAAGASGAYDPVIFEVIVTALADDHPTVRHKAVLAVFYARWPQFLPRLRELTADADESVREVSQLAIDAIDEPYPAG